MNDLSLALAFVLGAVVAVLLFLAIACVYALVRGYVTIRREGSAPSRNIADALLKSPIVPGVSVLYSPPDASPETRARVRRLLDLHYANSELVLVLDGAPEADLSLWTDELRLVPLDRSAGAGLPAASVRACYASRDPLRLLVIDKERGGEGDALNAAVNAARYPVLGLIDDEADFLPGFLLDLIRPMLQDWENTVAVCGVAPAPAGEGFAGELGSVESVRCWLARCAAFSAWNSVLPVPGCCLLVKRDAVLSAGGFGGGPVDFFLELHATERRKKLPSRIAFVPAPLSSRQVSRSLGQLRLQVMRDQSRLSAALRHYRPGAGWQFLGLFAVRVLRPLLETAALVLAAVGWASGAIRPELAALVLLSGAGTGIVISMMAVALGELAQPGRTAPLDLTRLFFTAIPENLGYRQLRSLWLIAAFVAVPDTPENRIAGERSVTARPR